MSKKPKFCIGDKVKIVNADELNPHEDSTEVEVGVVWVWFDDIGFFDYYIAFFGSEFPDNTPVTKPNGLRYSEAALRKWDESSK